MKRRPVSFSFLTPAAAAIAAAGALLCSYPVWAALNGQMPPPADVAAKMRDASAQILKGEIAASRPALLQLVETNATTDFTPLLSRVVGDDTTFNGVAATLEDAADAAKNETDRGRILYNLARLAVLRSRLATYGTGSYRGALDVASRAVARFDPMSDDPNVWETKGDVSSLAGDVDGALAAYRHMAKTGGADYAGRGLYKEGVAYEQANRAELAQSTLLSALRGENTTGRGGPALKYDIYQDLSRVYLMQGNDPAALSALAKSLQVSSDSTVMAGLTYRSDAARALLRRGYTKQVLAYADGGLRWAPDNFELQSLRDDARAGR